MATLKSSNPFSPSPERVHLAVQASWEAEACADAVVKLCGGLEVDAPEVFAIRSLAIRLRDMSAIVMNALGDEGTEVAELRRELTGLAESGA